MNVGGYRERAQGGLEGERGAGAVHGGLHRAAARDLDADDRVELIDDGGGGGGVVVVVF